MSPVERTRRSARVSVRNVGGIDDAAVEFSSGVTVLAGRNATNRTSLLRAIMAALGSDRVSLKADADEGRVELTMGEETYTRTLRRTTGSVTIGGSPYLSDPEVADLFAFLLESNDARRAVALDGDLRELLMRPVDTDELQAEIDRLEGEKRELDARIEELQRVRAELPDLERERGRLETEIEETRQELASLEADVEAHSAELEAPRGEQSRLESTLAELREARNELETLRYDVKTERRSLDALREEREELERDRAEYPEHGGEVDDLRAEIDRLRGRQAEIESTIGALGTVIQFNQEMLDGEGGIAAALADDEAVTDRLVDEGTIECWTCGTAVQRRQIEATVDRLREFRRDERDEKRSIEERIDELETEVIEHEEKRRQRRQIDERLREVEREIDERDQRLAELRERCERQADRVDELEADVETPETDEYDELLELHREANELEFHLGRLENELEDVEGEIERVERLGEELDERLEQRATVEAELDDLRTRIRRIETEAVDAFNDHVATLLDLLDYANLERIWIERVETGDESEAASAFELHVVRRTDDGVTYEDAVDHLSESEREVTGLVFALSGYLVHDVGEVVPFVLLDSLESIDAERIAALVDYFADYADFLLVALLPEDAAALDDNYEHVDHI